MIPYINMQRRSSPERLGRGFSSPLGWNGAQRDAPFHVPPPPLADQHVITITNLFECQQMKGKVRR